MTRSSMLWDIGGVMMTFADEETGRDSWRARLGLTEPGQLEEVLWTAIGSSGLSDTPAIIERLQRACDLSAADAERLLWDANDHWLVNEELVAFAARLRSSGVPSAVVGNAGAAARWAFEAIVGVDRFADVVVISAEVGVEKPDPAIFRLACDRLGVAPQECAFVDDVEDYVAAAAALGMAAFRHVSNETTMDAVTAALSLGSAVR